MHVLTVKFDCQPLILKVACVIELGGPYGQNPCCDVYRQAKRSLKKRALEISFFQEKRLRG